MRSVQEFANKCTGFRQKVYQSHKSDIIEKISEKAVNTRNERNQNVHKHKTNEKSWFQPDKNSKGTWNTPQNR